MYRAAGNERLWQWQPTDQQRPGFLSTATETWLFGGNRSGKTELACAIAAMCAQGIHPTRSQAHKPPLRIRHCATSWEDGIIGIILPKYRQLIPRHWLPNCSWSDAIMAGGRGIKFANGSVILFKSSEQDINKWGGDNLDICIQDEHLRKDYYIENKMRLADRNGFYIAAMTPEFGLTWEEDHVTDPTNAGVEHYFLETEQNPHLSRAGVEEIKARIKDPRLADVKLRGRFVPLSGLVIPTFNPGISIIPDRAIKPGASRVVAGDFHLKAPSAVLWGAWEADEQRGGFNLVIYRAIKRQQTIAEWKDELLIQTGQERIQSWIGDESERESTVKNIYGADSILAELRRPPKPISIVQAPKNPGSFEAGIMRLRDMFAEDTTGQPRIFIFQSCEHPVEYIDGKPHGPLSWELKQFQFKTERKADEESLREHVRTVNDHYISGLRYMIMHGPLSQGGELNFGINMYGT